MIILINLNVAELNYYPFMISVDKCNGSCNVADSLSIKTCVLSETKDINVKVFNMITRINGVKTLVKHILYYRKCKLDSTIHNPNKKWNNNKCINANVSV